MSAPESTSFPQVSQARTAWEAAKADQTMARDRLRDAVLAEVDAGAEIAKIAEAAGITRKTVYAWIDTHDDRANVARTISDAMAWLASMGVRQAASYTALSDDDPLLNSAITVLRGSLKTIPTSKYSSPDDKARVWLWGEVAGRALQYWQKHRRWPRTVSVDDVSEYAD